MHRTLLLILIPLLTGCAQYCGVDQPLSPTPVYPPMYDVKPVKNLISQSQVEVSRLEEFVNRSGNMLELNYAISFYKAACHRMLVAIETAPYAQVRYRPWQVQN